MSLEFEGDTKEIAQKTLELTEDNNKMLHSIQRRARLGFAFKVFYWIIIIGVGIGAFYYVQPYIDQVKNSYASIKETQSKLSDFPRSWEDVKGFFGTSTSEIK